MRKFRDWDSVSDILKLKVKHIEAEELELKKSYKKYKEEFKLGVSKAKFNRILRSISKQVQALWKRGKERNLARVKWLRKKYLMEDTGDSPGAEPGSGEETRSDWVRRMARGSGALRRKVEVQVPTYGGVTLDPDEEAALAISPKFRLSPKVSLEDMQLQT